MEPDAVFDFSTPELFALSTGEFARSPGAAAGPLVVALGGATELVVPDSATEFVAPAEVTVAVIVLGAAIVCVDVLEAVAAFVALGAGVVVLFVLAVTSFTESSPGVAAFAGLAAD